MEEYEVTDIDRKLLASYIPVTDIVIGDRVGLGAAWRTVTSIERRPQENPHCGEPCVLIEVNFRKNVEAEFRFYDPTMRVMVLR